MRASESGSPARGRSNFRAPPAFDAEFVKRRGFHDQGVLVVALDDHRLDWAQREMLKQIGVRLYGKRA